MARRHLLCVLVVLVGLTINPTSAQASTSPPVYKADLSVVVPPPASGTDAGQATLVRTGNDDRWVGRLNTKGLPAGNYSYALLIGTDLNGDGFPDSFSFRTLCTFTLSDNGTGGCVAPGVSLGITDLGDFASAQVVSVGNPTFLKATGPLAPAP